jgi:hypothetical protein
MGNPLMLLYIYCKVNKKPASRGAGLSGTTAAKTAQVTKDQVLPTVVAIIQPVHNGGYTAHTNAAIAPPTSGVNPYRK